MTDKDKMDKAQKTDPVCEVEATIKIIGGRWKPMIIYLLFSGPHRFGELQQRIPGITQKMLTQQLRDLEADQIVHRELFAAVPPKVEYSITEVGKTLQPIMTAIYHWAETYRQATERSTQEMGTTAAREQCHDNYESGSGPSVRRAGRADV